MAPVQAIVELFASPYWTGRASNYFLTRPGTIIVRDSLYWCVLIIAFHGMRREEAAQLHSTRQVRRYRNQRPDAAYLVFRPHGPGPEFERAGERLASPRSPSTGNSNGRVS